MMIKNYISNDSTPSDGKTMSVSIRKKEPNNYRAQNNYQIIVVIVILVDLISTMHMQISLTTLKHLTKGGYTIDPIKSHSSTRNRNVKNMPHILYYDRCLSSRQMKITSLQVSSLNQCSNHGPIGDNLRKVQHMVQS